MTDKTVPEPLAGAIVALATAFAQHLHEHKPDKAQLLEMLRNVTLGLTDSLGLPPHARLILARHMIEEACAGCTELTYKLAADGSRDKLDKQAHAFKLEADAIANMLTDTQIRFNTIPAAVKETPK